LLKKWSSDISYLADYDPTLEKKLERQDIFSFYHNLNDRKERQQKQENSLNSVPFGDKFGH
jgi:hypothetical protein